MKKNKKSAKLHSNPKSRLLRPVKINFLCKATFFFAILCFIFFFLTYFLSNLAIAEAIIDFLTYLIIASFFAALLFATLSIFYYLIKFIKKLSKKIKKRKLCRRCLHQLQDYLHRLKAKIKAMDKRPIYIALIILLTLAIWLLPAFIYNQLEWHSRQNRLLSDGYFIEVERGIYIRQQGGASSYYETLFEVSDKIESLIKKGLEQLQIAQEYNDKQQFCLLFLSKDYKDYHQAKTASLQRYYSSYQQFLKQKEQEHLCANAIFLLDKLNGDLVGILRLAYEEQVLANIPVRVAEIENKRQQLLEQGLINETANQYYQSELEFFLAFNSELEKFYASGNPADFDTSVYQQRQEFDENIEIAFRQKMDELSQRAKKITEELNSSGDDFSGVLVAYIKAGLNLDQLSKLLAIFRDDFPRVIMSEEEIEEYEKSKDGDDVEESEPVKVPSKAIWELVG